MLPTGAGITVTFSVHIAVHRNPFGDMTQVRTTRDPRSSHQSHRESRLDRLGRLLPFALDGLDRRCDDIASSVLCTASAYLYVNLGISKGTSHPEKVHRQEFITYELAFELFVLQSRSDEFILSALERYHHN